MSVNEPKCAQGSLNKPKGACMSLKQLKFIYLFCLNFVLCSRLQQKQKNSHLYNLLHTNSYTNGIQ